MNLVRIDPPCYRRTEVDFLLGDPSKARRILEWEPSVTFHQLVRIMVRADIHPLLNMRRYLDVILRIVKRTLEETRKGAPVVGRK